MDILKDTWINCVYNKTCVEIDIDLTIIMFMPSRFVSQLPCIKPRMPTEPILKEGRRRQCIEFHTFTSKLWIENYVVTTSHAGNPTHPPGSAWASVKAEIFCGDQQLFRVFPLYIISSRSSSSYLNLRFPHGPVNSRRALLGRINHTDSLIYLLPLLETFCHPMSSSQQSGQTTS